MCLLTRNVKLNIFNDGNKNILNNIMNISIEFRVGHKFNMLNLKSEDGGNQHDG
jgi:hypothetical protein